jgi:transposase
MADKPHPEMGYRACLGIIRLSRRYGRERLEAACRRALDRSVCTYRSIQSILASGLDQHAVPEPVSPAPAIQHTNLRGAEYYN